MQSLWIFYNKIKKRLKNKYNILIIKTSKHKNGISANFKMEQINLKYK